MPVSNGSTVYNCVLTLTYSCASASLIPDSYNIDITTYEIYRQWYPFTNYMVNDKTIYYNQTYESVIDNNLTNNPLKYQNAPQWQYEGLYNIGDIVEYNDYIYIYTAQSMTASVGATFSPTASLVDPFLDTLDWLNITEWKQVDLSPVQSVSEFRTINNMNPYNFTIDSNIDPFLVIEVSSDNGYGGAYSDRKNYDINGILNLVELEQFANMTVQQYQTATLPVAYSGN